MAAPLIDDEPVKLLAWCHGNPDAAKLLADLFEVSQLADDLVDEAGGPRSQRMVHLLHLALVVIPANPFYDRFKGWLAPLLSAAVLGWDAANEWERSRDDTRQAFAFSYRDLLELVVVQVAHLVGGREHARTVQREAFQYFRFQHRDGQTFRAWQEEMT